MCRADKDNWDEFLFNEQFCSLCERKNTPFDCINLNFAL